MSKGKVSVREGSSLRHYSSNSEAFRGESQIYQDRGDSRYEANQKAGDFIYGSGMGKTSGPNR